MEEKELNQEFMGENTQNDTQIDIENNDLEKEFGQEMGEDIDFDVDLTPDDEILNSQGGQQVNETIENNFNFEPNQGENQASIYQEEQDIDENFTQVLSTQEMSSDQIEPIENETSVENHLEINFQTQASNDQENNINSDIPQSQFFENISIPKENTQTHEYIENGHLTQNAQKTENIRDQDIQSTMFTSDLGSKLVAALENKNTSTFEETKEFEMQNPSYTSKEVENCSPQDTNIKESSYEKRFTEVESKYPSENVRKLIHLINTLPADVSKKTGAIIIKHTMEAMGVSIKELISEARSIKNEININIRNSMNEIAEARKHISDLEYDINQSKNLSMQLDDLIGLFIVVD